MNPAQTPSPEPSSKVWVAGAVVGPILGLALVGAGFWLFLRRKKKAVQLPQHGSASMAPIDPYQPPMGVGGFSDTKPQFHSAQPTYYDRPGQPYPYAQQGYPRQEGFSPVPQYGFQSEHNAIGDPHREAKYEGVSSPAELGGNDSGISPDTVPMSELSGADGNRPDEGTPGNDKPQ